MENYNINEGCANLNGYTKQELEQSGFISSLFGGKPAANAWKEINNILADATNAQELTSDKVKKALKNWGTKFSEENMQERSSIYRKTADNVFTEVMTSDDPLFEQATHLAKVLELPEHLVGLANKGAKTAAYFNRCNKIIKGEEKLSIGEINNLFGYDYEDGLSIRKQVFQANFNLEFEDISKERRYSPAQEERYRKQCEALDIPYEFKSNITNALEHYRDLWNAENSEFNKLEVEGLPLAEGESCHCYANAGLCEKKTVEREDNLFEMTRKFKIDEIVSFNGDKLEQPKITEEITAVEDVGYFFVTNHRIIYASEKLAKQVTLDNIEAVEFDGTNIISYKTKDQGTLIFKYPDDAAEVMVIIVNRIIQQAQAKA